MLRAAAAIESGDNTPTSGRIDDGCAASDCGLRTAAPAATPPSRVMNSRRFTAQYLLCLNEKNSIPLVLLRCGILARLRTGLGQKQTARHPSGYVRFTPEGGHQTRQTRTSA
jgi:hypothetical protein